MFAPKGPRDEASIYFQKETTDARLSGGQDAEGAGSPVVWPLPPGSLALCAPGAPLGNHAQARCPEASGTQKDAAATRHILFPITEPGLGSGDRPCPGPRGEEQGDR